MILTTLAIRLYCRPTVVLAILRTIVSISHNASTVLNTLVTLLCACVFLCFFFVFLVFYLFISKCRVVSCLRVLYFPIPVDDGNRIRQK